MTGFLYRARPAWLLHALFVASVLTTTFLSTPQAQAQLLPGGDSAGEETAAAPADDMPDPLGGETPRGMVDGLISALAQDDYQRAARFLDLAEMPEGLWAVEGPELARALQLALDRAGFCRAISYRRRQRVCPGMIWSPIRTCSR